MQIWRSQKPIFAKKWQNEVLDIGWNFGITPNLVTPHPTTPKTLGFVVKSKIATHVRRPTIAQPYTNPLRKPLRNFTLLLYLLLSLLLTHTPTPIVLLLYRYLTPTLLLSYYSSYSSSCSYCGGSSTTTPRGGSSKDTPKVGRRSSTVIVS